MPIELPFHFHSVIMLLSQISLTKQDTVVQKIGTFLMYSLCQKFDPDPDKIKFCFWFWYYQPDTNERDKDKQYHCFSCVLHGVSFNNVNKILILLDFKVLTRRKCMLYASLFAIRSALSIARFWLAYACTSARPASNMRSQAISIGYVIDIWFCWSCFAEALPHASSCHWHQILLAK